MQPRDNKWGIPREMVVWASIIITPIVVGIAVALFAPSISHALSRHSKKQQTNNAASVTLSTKIIHTEDGRK